MVTAESIKTGIEAGLTCEHVEVMGDGQHFQAVVVSSGFAGKKLVAVASPKVPRRRPL